MGTEEVCFEESALKSLGILGFGSFGRFAARHLCQHFAVTVSDREPVVDVGDLPICGASVEEAAGCDVVILSVPVQDMRQLLVSVRDRFKPGALVVDVASVKERPATVMDECLPSTVRFLGLHPMFGPQSGKDGIEGLKVVLCRPSDSTLCASDEEVRCVTDFLLALNLQILPMTAAEHDREMAYVQGLTHWIAKALREIHLPDLKLATPAYRHLLSIEEILREDSLELFMTIQRENDFAETARSELLQRLHEIEKLVTASRSSVDAEPSQ